jgi:hypothetical protein
VNSVDIRAVTVCAARSVMVTIGAVGSIYDMPGWCLLQDDCGIATAES